MILQKNRQAAASRFSSRPPFPKARPLIDEIHEMQEAHFRRIENRHPLAALTLYPRIAKRVQAADREHLIAEAQADRREKMAEELRAALFNTLLGTALVAAGQLLTALSSATGALGSAREALYNPSMWLSSFAAGIFFGVSGALYAGGRTGRMQEERALIDQLTGLFTRKHFDKVLGSMLTRGRTQKLSVVMLDMDNFKAVNDTYGFKTGNSVLSELGRLLGSICRPNDVVSRYGGEEFMVLMPRTSATEAAVGAERYRQAIERHFATTPVTRIVGEDTEMMILPKTVSVGVVQYEEWMGGEGERFLQRADDALSVAKGKKRVHGVKHKNLVCMYRDSAYHLGYALPHEQGLFFLRVMEKDGMLVKDGLVRVDLASRGFMDAERRHEELPVQVERRQG